MDHTEAKTRLAAELRTRVGRARAVGMAELYWIVWGAVPLNRINQTRGLRTLVTELRAEGQRVCSDDTGYWLAADAGELSDNLNRRDRRAIRALVLSRKQRDGSLADLQGQIAIEWEGPDA